MESIEKQVSYTSNNTYETLNSLTESTENVWVVFHGIGFLSKYFLRFFKKLDTKKNYIIAPQAPSKYYLNNEFKYVGASWLTKENTKIETGNVLNYVDALIHSENIPPNKNLIILGFSQGVSIATRWIASRKLKFNTLIVYAGSIPNELRPIDFNHIDFNTVKVELVYGDKDEYLSKKRIAVEKQKSDSLFKQKAKTTIFNGGHEIKPEVLKKFE